MALIKCKCGKSEMNFTKLTEEDLPEGFENDCCKAMPAKEDTQAPVDDEKTETPEDAPAEQPADPTAEAPVTPESQAEGQSEQAPVEGSGKGKNKRGPKPKKTE